MELGAINASILKKICKTVGMKLEKSLSASLIRNLSRKLTDGKVDSDQLQDLFGTLSSLGFDLSHIDIKKVEKNDDVHTYLFLDFLYTLFQALLSDNQDSFKLLVSRYERDKSRDAEEKGGTTSGAEEVDKILEEARRKYGKIRSFRQHLVEKENLSFVPHVAPLAGISQVDHSTAANQLLLTKHVVTTHRKRKHADADSSTAGGGSSSSTSIKSASSATSAAQAYSQSSGSSGRARKKEKRARSAHVNEEEEEEEVDIRIPLEECSVNVKIKRNDGKPVGNRRIHVRLQRDPSPKKSKKIVYGTKSVLYHHHRKNRPPIFSKKPPTPKLPDKQVLRGAVNMIKKTTTRRQNEEEENKQKEKMENVNLECQRYLREIRTRNGQLKKLALDLNNK